MCTNRCCVQTARIIGTHDIPLLGTIERALWRAIMHIATGTNPILAIDTYVVKELPWDKINMLDLDDEINERFRPSK